MYVATMHHKDDGYDFLSRRIEGRKLNFKNTCMRDLMNKIQNSCLRSMIEKTFCGIKALTSVKV